MLTRVFKTIRCSTHYAPAPRKVQFSSYRVVQTVLERSRGSVVIITTEFSVGTSINVDISQPTRRTSYITNILHCLVYHPLLCSSIRTDVSSDYNDYYTGSVLWQHLHSHTQRPQTKTMQ